MKQLASLFWKEWHETRLFLWIGLGVFLGLPWVGGLEALFQYDHHYEFLASPWVIIFGGVFALFVAVGVTCRDLGGQLEEFWRSRPVGVMRWFLVKYVVGLAVSLAVCVLPMLVERWFSSKDAVPLVALALMPFHWTALYSVAFASGCLVRRPAHAAMLALAVLLLIHFLPLALPPLNGLNVIEVFDSYGVDRGVFTARAITFALGMAVIATATLALSIAAVRYRWRVDAGQRLMYGAVSAALLIIVATAGYQLGTNLPILQQAAIPETERVSRIAYDGKQDFVITHQWIGEPYPYIDRGNWKVRFRSLALAQEGIRLGDPQPALDPGYWNNWWQQSRLTASVPAHPRQVYYVYDDSDSQIEYRLAIRTTDPTQPFVKGRGLKLWAENYNSSSRRPVIQLWENRLYVIGDQLAILDITDPIAPQLISVVPVPQPSIVPDEPVGFLINLPRVPGLPKEQRLNAAIHAWGSWYFPDDRVLCQNAWVRHGDPGLQLIAWHLEKLTDEAATFEPMGTYKQTLLEEIFESSSMSQMTMRDGLLYVVQTHGQYANSRVTVFDLRGIHPLRPVAHFGGPDIWAVCPLPGGRALIGGSQLWLVGPPPTRN